MLEKPKRSHLNRSLSKLGFCSRTIADTWIASGRVCVNGMLASDPEQWVEIGTDKIEVDGSTLPGSLDKPGARALIYLCLHKPPGYVTTRSDELGRKTVYDLLPHSEWIFPVGRLDLESEGLLLLTNDGEWANLLTDPLFHLEKEYRVKLDGAPLPNDLEIFRQGIMLDGKLTLPARLESEGKSWYRVVITEGRNRQIRRMFHSLGYKVKRLVRIRVGSFELGDLPEGKSRPLEIHWIEKLRAEATSRGI